jgi:hypothetical protein
MRYRVIIQDRKTGQEITVKENLFRGEALVLFRTCLVASRGVWSDMPRVVRYGEVEEYFV